MNDILHTPTTDEIKNSQAFDFIQKINNFYNINIQNWQELYDFSITRYQDFWSFFLEYSNIIYSGDKSCVVVDTDDFIQSKFFPNVSLNFAQNLLQHSQNNTDIAIISWVENTRKFRITGKELYENVTKLAQYLKDNGVQKGDRVAVMLPNIHETVVCMLATTSIGAVFSSTSPDFGVSGVLDRFLQITPKVFIGIDGYYYNNKTYDCLEKTTQIISALHADVSILVNLIGEQTIPNCQQFNEIITQNTIATLEFTQVNFNDPLYILFSSGTTGKPKCIVHSVGGTLIQHQKEHILHAEIKPKDIAFYFTTCGWMMWNWLTSALTTNATIALYDGCPIPKKNPSILFDFAEQENFTHMGVSAKYLEAIEKLNITPKHSHNLPHLNIILSTGSVLSPHSFDYIYNSIKNDLFLMSISGGTDIVSCFVLGSKMLPVRRGYLQTRGLGMAVEVFDTVGNSTAGSQGELVCTQPFPSQPLYFWNDENNKKYYNSYFVTYENIWHHGDYVQIENDGQIMFFGRSDATLNPGGVRIGTAEIYNQVEKISEVLESVVIGKNHNNDVEVILFVVLQNNTILDEKLIDKIKQQIKQHTTPRHIPKYVYQVKDIPKTRSGKISEIVVKKIINNEELDNLEALQNTQCLQEFEQFKNINNT